MASTLRRVIDARMAIAEELDAVAGLVAVSRSPLEQIVMNLVLNSRDAISGLGTIVLVTARRDGNVHLRVTDTGCRMSSDTRRRVLEPFFTTKAQMGGTGLGLSMVRTIVARAGGSIDIESALGAGTSIDISFPVVNAN